MSFFSGVFVCAYVRVLWPLPSASGLYSEFDDAVEGRHIRLSWHSNPPDPCKGAEDELRKAKSFLAAKWPTTKLALKALAIQANTAHELEQNFIVILSRVSSLVQEAQTAAEKGTKLLRKQTKYCAARISEEIKSQGRQAQELIDKIQEMKNQTENVDRKLDDLLKFGRLKFDIVPGQDFIGLAKKFKPQQRRQQNGKKQNRTILEVIAEEDLARDLTEEDLDLVEEVFKTRDIVEDQKAVLAYEIWVRPSLSNDFKLEVLESFVNYVVTTLNDNDKPRCLMVIFCIPDLSQDFKKAALDKYLGRDLQTKNVQATALIRAAEQALESGSAEIEQETFNRLHAWISAQNMPYSDDAKIIQQLIIKREKTRIERTQANAPTSRMPKGVKAA